MRLIKLWEGGHTLADIGTTLRCTGNAVSIQACRLGLVRARPTRTYYVINPSTLAVSRYLPEFNEAGERAVPLPKTAVPTIGATSLVSVYSLTVALGVCYRTLARIIATYNVERKRASTRSKGDPKTHRDYVGLRAALDAYKQYLTDWAATETLSDGARRLGVRTPWLRARMKKLGIPTQQRCHRYLVADIDRAAKVELPSTLLNLVRGRHPHQLLNRIKRRDRSAGDSNTKP